MAMEFWSTKWNRYWMSGLSVDNPLFCFGTVKNNPEFMKIGPKSSMCCLHELCGNCVSSSELTLMYWWKIVPVHDDVLVCVV